MAAELDVVGGQIPRGSCFFGSVFGGGCGFFGRNLGGVGTDGREERRGQNRADGGGMAAVAGTFFTLV